MALVAFGNCVDIALDARDMLVAAGETAPTVVNARFAKPLDERLLCELALTHDRLITLEEHSLDGGFGSAVIELLNDRRIRTSVERIGCPNVLMQQNSQPKQRALVGLSAEAIVERIRTPLGTPASV